MMQGSMLKTKVLVLKLGQHEGLSKGVCDMAGVLQVSSPSTCAGLLGRGQNVGMVRGKSPMMKSHSMCSWNKVQSMRGGIPIPAAAV